jgi:O-antigen/teichoic acid export membrane protein
VYGYSLAINLISRCGTWTAMLVGANLWTTSVASLLSICFTSGFLKKRYWPFFRTLFLTKPSGPRVSWRNEIWPFQWRIALSWASGYFSFSLFTPILFAYQGPVVAGKFGLTWALVGVLGSLSNSWLSPKVPKFGMLIARRDYQELDRLFFRTTKAVIGVCSLAAVGIGCGIYVLTWFYHALADRLLAPLPLGILLLAQIVLCVSTPFSTYLRAHKREPLLVLSIIGGVATGLSTFLLGKYYSVDAVCFGYFSVTVLLCPLVLVIWHTCRKAWHNS